MSNAIANVKEFQGNVIKQVKDLRDKGEINFPVNYSPQNAMKSAFLIIQQTLDRNKQPAMDVCTKESIANALLDTVIQGLSPAKKQVYYIVRGNKLTMMRSYHGTTAVTKRVEGVKDVFAEVVYDGDEFEFKIEGAAKKIVKHVQTLESIDGGKIRAAYCTIIKDDGSEYSDLMTINQIKKAWTRGQTKGNSSAHNEQPEEMARRTVLNRTCKAFLNTSDDSDLIMGPVNSPDPEDIPDEVETEIQDNANQGEIIDIPATPEPKPAPKKETPKETPKQASLEEEAGF